MVTFSRLVAHYETMPSRVRDLDIYLEKIIIRRYMNLSVQCSTIHNSQFINAT